MFTNSNFNQPIGDWDVSSAITTKSMFYNALNFKQDLSKWNLPENVLCENMFYNCILPDKSYYPKIIQERYL
jgi:hypothetical protein